MAALTEVATQVYVLREPSLGVNATVVVGAEVAVVVDTLATPDQAGALLAGVREITPLPLAVVNTHGHADHCGGNAVLAQSGPGETGIWAHEATVRWLRRPGAQLRERWCADARVAEAGLSDQVAALTPWPPDRPVHSYSTTDIGDRGIELRHLGRGHTDGDLVVFVPDARVVVTGDLVERDGPPSFTDAYPVEWAETLASLREHTPVPAVVVPGHGAVGDESLLARVHDEFTTLAWLIRDGHADGAPAEAVAAKSALPDQSALVAVRRGYAELAGQI